MTEQHPPPSRPARKSTDLWIALALAAIALAVHGPLLRWGLKLGDDGYFAYAVERIDQGQVLYRDFQRVYAPGIYYLALPLFRLFGNDLVTARALCLGLFAALVASMFLVARPLAPRWAAGVAALLPVFLAPPLHKVFLPLTAILGLWIAGTVLSESLRPRRALAVGLGIGALALVRQDVGAFVFLITAASLAPIVRRLLGGASGRRERLAPVWAGIVGGILALWVPVLVAFAACGALPSFIDDVALAGLWANREIGLPFPSLLGGSLSLEMVLFHLPGLAAALGAFVVTSALLRHRLRRAHLIVAQWTVMTLLLHSQFLLRSDLAHVTQAMVVPALLLACFMGTLWERSRPWRPLRAGKRLARWGACALVVGALSVMTWGAVRGLWPAYRGRWNGVALGEPRADVVLWEWRRQKVAEILRLVRQLTRTGEPVFVAPYAPILYYLTERPNPTRYDLVLPGDSSSVGAQEEIIRDLETSGVRLVLIDDTAFDNREERRFANYAPFVQAYLDDNFEVERRVMGWAFYLRTGDDHAGRGGRGRPRR